MLVTGYLLLVLALVCELLAAFGYGKDIPVAMLPLGIACFVASCLVRGWPWPPRA